MGLTYDGITYRSLEEQVRYDAEQVQLLKQADVTINQNLQTVNENLQMEISGKLTKPTNPSAESAITMLADGTVGTKLLSEIGGGKIYKHSAIGIIFSSGGDSIDATVFNVILSVKKIDMSNANLIVNELALVNLSSSSKYCIVSINNEPNAFIYVRDENSNIVASGDVQRIQFDNVEEL